MCSGSPRAWLMPPQSEGLKTALHSVRQRVLSLLSGEVGDPLGGTERVTDRHRAAQAWDESVAQVVAGPPSEALFSLWRTSVLESGLGGPTEKGELRGERQQEGVQSSVEGSAGRSPGAALRQEGPLIWLPRGKDPPQGFSPAGAEGTGRRVQRRQLEEVGQGHTPPSTGS